MTEENETLTWRLNQASLFLQEAHSSHSTKTTDGNNDTEADLQEIKNLIKKKIWIKKKAR